MSLFERAIQVTLVATLVAACGLAAVSTVSGHVQMMERQEQLRK